MSQEPIVTNQIELHPFLDQTKVIDACQKHRIAVTAYCPIARGNAAGDKVLARVGRQHGKSAAQVSLRYLVQQGIIAIPRTSKSERLKENLAVFDFDAERRRDGRGAWAGASRRPRRQPGACAGVGLMREASPDGALVLFSGGQDSTVCLAWALERFARVETVGFDYGQRHAIELDARPHVRQALAAMKPEWAARLGDDHLIPLDALGAISETALTRDVAIEIAAERAAEHVRAGPQPGVLQFRRPRWRTGAGSRTWSAACARPTFPAIRTAATTPSRRCKWRSRLGMDRPFVIDTPLMWIDKAATWALAAELGGQRLGRCDRRGHPHLLPRRARPAPRMGLRLRGMPGVRGCAPQGFARWREKRSRSPCRKVCRD